MTTPRVDCSFVYSFSTQTLCTPDPVTSAIQKSPNGLDTRDVRYRSPFRYPGGKTWLVPYIRRWLSSLENKPLEFIEPFVGGGSVGLTVAAEELTHHVTLVELDDDVAAVWQTIIAGDARSLAQRILTFRLTRESVDALMAKEPSSLEDIAFQTIVRNRVNHGGKLAPGAGRIKRGENGKGIGSRWYPDTLYRRILLIAKTRDRMTFVHGDGMRTLQDNLHRHRAAFFIDPPYVAGGEKPGRRLYRHSDLDHTHVFELASQLVGDFLMTYQNTTEVVGLAQAHGLEIRPISMRTTRHTVKTELLISRDLGWLADSRFQAGELGKVNDA